MLKKIKGKVVYIHFWVTWCGACIPHYELVNKKGEVVKYKMGHNSNEKLKVILEKEIKNGI